MELNVQKINYLLKNSLESYKAVEKIIKNNNLLFSQVFQVFLQQEILEILIFLGNIQEVFQQFENINFILEQQENFKQNHFQFFLCQSYQNQSKNLTEENSFNKIKCTANGEVNIINQIYEIQKSRQKFLRGLIEIKQYNYREAIEQFTLFIEEGSYYSCQLRRKAIHHLNQLFMIEFNKQIDLKKIYLDQKACIPYDITIIIQLEYQKFFQEI
ncbi:tetratricopeptide repeat protein (macronuclear) [Tetrahymena thermophila SB210]|uniref:Tetratricopeptide repeat protein n=1 Tax=Tetrahymena thermophila (strain SB210) TaxID=312017 RepID=W7XJR8_TETTS|nr:tetratricopeptide repeat protein [Tetrahymena thermophila SB210]EWS75871.1 tetratricopeptide repeat protein [Tetrahymena thermophila SB210]|eukprot:XP_012651594.1 tetratricopeptide repeat protein [Tetrahymena thermophila SB210]